MTLFQALIRATPQSFAAKLCLIFRGLALVAVLTRHAEAQSPPDPNYQRQQIFDSYQQFKDRLNAISAMADATQRTSELNSLWTQLKAAGQIPYAQGNQTAFLYRGSPTNLYLAGDFNGWSGSSSAWRAVQLANTDLWMLEKTFPTAARLDYKFANSGNWILDPVNTLQMWSGFGPNSELRMPDYKYPQETVRQAGVSRGALSGNIKVASRQLGYDVNYRVYTPPGYNPQQSHNLPVVYVTDGHEYSADYMGSMVVVLDNLISAKSLQPTIAVFIDPREPANQNNNRRATEYVQNPKFAGFVADELVPTIDGAFRSLASPGGRTILGTSLGGLNSAYFGATRPEVFGNIAVQSPASFSQFTPGLLNTYATQPLQSKLDLFVTGGTIGDGDGGASFVSVLQQHHYDYKYLQVNEGHSWGNWRGLLDSILTNLVGPTPVPEADFNEDGKVDAADLALWKTSSGKATAATHLNGDADGDRDVDGADYLLWQRQQNASPPPTTSVPEPNAQASFICVLGAAVASTRCGATPTSAGKSHWRVRQTSCSPAPAPAH
jgi:enterochelin esterase family protein